MRPNEIMVMEFDEAGAARYRLWYVPDKLANEVACMVESEVGPPEADQIREPVATS